MNTTTALDVIAAMTATGEQTTFATRDGSQGVEIRLAGTAVEIYTVGHMINVQDQGRVQQSAEFSRNVPASVIAAVADYMLTGRY